MRDKNCTTTNECPECNGTGYTSIPCDECEGNPEEVGGTECAKCGGDGFVETKCPMCTK